MSLFLPEHEQVNKKRLCDFFGFTSVDNVETLHHGYKSDNFVFEADGAKYFLKRYNRLGYVAHEIKKSEQFFADEHIPVLLPCKDRYGRSVFGLDRTWCSLFPFIEGIKLRAKDLTADHLQALAILMATMHRMGANVDPALFSPIHFWHHEQFFWEYQELVDLIHARASKSAFDQHVLCLLEQKRAIVSSFLIETIQIPHSHGVLIHGDLIFQNLFWNEKNEITHLFDFEKTCIGPRAYEFARSLMINCFDDGWGDEQFKRARFFLEVYRSELSFSFEELLSGMQMYWMNMAHMIWIETKYVLLQTQEIPELYRSHANRVSHLHEDPKDFCERIYGDH